jgi:hypothetical protein
MVEGKKPNGFRWYFQFQYSEIRERSRQTGNDNVSSSTIADLSLALKGLIVKPLRGIAGYRHQVVVFHIRSKCARESGHA